jgi:LPS-assembly protein
VPDKSTIYVEGVHKDLNGPIKRFSVAARVETIDMLLRADEITYNEDSGDIEAVGHVHFEHFLRGEKIDCDRAEYNMDDETGNFYDVSGSAQSQIQARPGLLTTQTPFFFQAKWAERLKDHYVLHDGFLTDCLIPNPWWRLKGPVFDIVPGDHAIARNSWFYIRKMPLFYAPWFYKSLKKEPRRSGFLIPNFGNSSAHGKMFGTGYYWAISRSFDMTYRGLYYSQAGIANYLDFRGKVNQKTDFDLNIFGVYATQDSPISQSGYRLTLHAKSDLGNGWEARGVLDYLSSLAFLQDFTQSFTEAVTSETHSVAYVTKHWSDYGVNFVAQRDVSFQSTTPGQTIETRKLPSAEFLEREHEVDFNGWPFWVSFDASAGFLDRSQPDYQTRQFVDRIDVAPHITTAFRWHDIQLIPTFGIRETQYGESFNNVGQVSGQNLLRSSRDLTVDLILPSLERIFDSPDWIGKKVKHVIEPRITYKYVTGINNFDQVLRFDENDLVSNTNQMEFSLTNRLLAKDKNGTITDFLTWQLRYDRYFDPTFGGAVQPCQTTTSITSAFVPSCRNVVASELDLTGFAFLDTPRSYSPIVSVFRIQSRVGFEWRTDYDPAHGGIVNSTVNVDGRVRKYFWSVGHTEAHTDPVLLPPANQLHVMVGYGNPRTKGWNYGFQMFYDYRQSKVLFWDAQGTYNTDCCGFSVQYRRFSIGTRDDSQIQVSFAVSNIGTFGTLKRQDSIF